MIARCTVNQIITWNAPPRCSKIERGLKFRKKGWGLSENIEFRRGCVVGLPKIFGRNGKLHNHSIKK